MAFYDQLTSMPDKTTFLRSLGEALARAKKENLCIGLILLDVDDYRAINDRFGHEAGDVLLNTLAERLRCSIRETDTAAYFGEDTFAVMLVNSKDMAVVVLAAERIRKSLGEPLLLQEGTDCRVGVSVGIAVYPENGAELDRLLTVADSAMFESKTSGKNMYTAYKGLTRERADVLPWIALGEEHLIGISVVDEQHQMLVNLINELHESIKSPQKKVRQNAVAMYDKLISFTEIHFMTEARLMSEAGYPQSDAHSRAHKFLLAELRYLKTRIIEGGELKSFQFLKDWLVAHIERDDKQMGEFLRAKRGDGTVG